MTPDKLDRLRLIRLQLEELNKETRLTITRKLQVRLEDYGFLSLSNSAIEVIKKVIIADQDERLFKLNREFQEG